MKGQKPGSWPGVHGASDWTLDPRQDLASGAFRVKSRINLRDTWSKRQAGAMRPVRRAGWVWAESCAPAAKSCVG